jgi:hypothetical protein
LVGDLSVAINGLHNFIIPEKISEQYAFSQNSQEVELQSPYNIQFLFDVFISVDV